MKLVDENGKEWEVVESKVSLRKGDLIIRPVGRWRATPGERSSYWVIMPEIYASKTTDKDRGIDKRRHKLGNYFKSQEDGEIVAEAIKTLLEYVQLPWKTFHSLDMYETPEQWATLNKKAAEARKAIQGKL